MGLVASVLSSAAIKFSLLVCTLSQGPHPLPELVLPHLRREQPKFFSQDKETDACFQVPSENLYQFSHQHLELNISDSVFPCCTHVLETEVILGKLGAAFSFCTASSSEDRSSVSWPPATALLYSVITILSAQTIFLQRAPSQGIGFRRCFYFSPILLPLSVFRPVPGSPTLVK